MSSAAPFEYSSRPALAEDELFLERLDSFLQKNLADIKAFSERELRPFEETRRTVAEWHAKYLFQPTASPMSLDRKQHARSVMIDTSRLLENLASTSAIQSFFLAIDPRDDVDPGFLGGSIQGRAFWRNLRGGGDQGAKAFKQHCAKANVLPQPQGLSVTGLSPQTPATHSTSSGLSKQDAKSVKADLYEIVRQILRKVSGHPAAEMKWTNHERLDIYGVRLSGWPDGIPEQNPSTLKLSQNKQLLEAFKSGAIKFERHPANIHPLPNSGLPSEEEFQVEEDDLSWALDTDAVASGTGSSSGQAIPSTSYRLPAPRVPANPAPPVSLAENLAQETTPVDYTHLYDPPWSTFDPSSVSEPGMTDMDWLEEPRNRKRRRSQGDDGSCVKDEL
ncbi:hypothetical protein BKA70DRAFT_1277389 [Coprinopsis sp. MPI-PUGE-AT-0042]|nr:hypothetical protein BKA70DRAFT_1277389 [Coprinopsis sp. MPI-PUGE-AT-0042]